VSHIKLRYRAAALIPAACLMVGCSIFNFAPTPTPTIMPTLADRSTPTPTATPDPCTGWRCGVNGVVYADEVRSGKELAGASLTLIHSSYCSPTRGEYRTETGPDGTFEFGEVFFHDTDRIRIQIESAGYEPTTWDSVDLYCFFCSCFASPLEIVLRAAPDQ
jgi:hypothetical protein